MNAYTPEMKGYDLEIQKYLEDNNLPCVNKSWGICTFINGVQAEWNTDTACLVVGWKNNNDDRKNLKALMNEKFNNSVHSSDSTPSVRFSKNPKPADFYKLVEIVQNLPFEIEQRHGLKRGSVAFNQEGYFYKTAKIIRFAVVNEYPHLLNRTALGFDAVDDLIIIGESTSVTEENRYREHIVPCDFIIREAVEMVKENCTDTEIASMIKNNLSIVIISNEEAKKLDSELGLKTDMPKDWKIGNDIFARLEAAKITVK